MACAITPEGISVGATVWQFFGSCLKAFLRFQLRKFSADDSNESTHAICGASGSSIVDWGVRLVGSGVYEWSIVFESTKVDGLFEAGRLGLW